MSWNPIDPAELMPGNAILPHMIKARDCLAFLYGQIGTLSQNAIPNGSFEVDSAGSGQPDSWTFSAYPGGSGAIDPTSADGANAYKIVHPGGAGNGGGLLESDYSPCSSLKRVYLGFCHWASVAGLVNQVQVRFFDRAKTEIAGSAQLIFDANLVSPTVPTRFVASFLPPATARFCKIGLIGGGTAASVAGSAWFDAVEVLGVIPAVVAPQALAIVSVGASGNWTDMANLTFAAPYASLTAIFSVIVTVTSGVDARLISGATIGNEATSSITGDLRTRLELPLPLSATAATGPVTVTVQARSSTGGFVSVADPTATVRIMPL